MPTCHSARPDVKTIAPQSKATESSRDFWSIRTNLVGPHDIAAEFYKLLRFTAWWTFHRRLSRSTTPSVGESDAGMVDTLVCWYVHCSTVLQYCSGCEPSRPLLPCPNFSLLPSHPPRKVVITALRERGTIELDANLGIYHQKTQH